jgi:hypothetical protein
VSLPSRRLIRPTRPPAPDSAQRHRRLQRLRARLDQDRAALARWMKRLKRAFRAMEKCQARVTRAEREIARQEE